MISWEPEAMAEYSKKVMGKDAFMFSESFNSSLIAERIKFFFTETGIILFYQIDQTVNANME